MLLMFLLFIFLFDWHKVIVLLLLFALFLFNFLHTAFPLAECLHVLEGASQHEVKVNADVNADDGNEGVATLVSSFNRCEVREGHDCVQDEDSAYL